MQIPWSDWEIKKKIGDGSYGSVFEIERTDEFGHAEKAALKVISIPKEESEIEALIVNGYDEDSVTEYFRTSLNSIINEYAMMAQLKSHPNIVTCEDRKAVRQENGIGWDVYIRMELLKPFTKTIKGKEVTEEEVLKLAKDMLHALKACHELDIIHRDIKPDNIFVTRYGDYKLGDFGVARIMTHTTNATKTGTPNYMAPEVSRNERYGKEADIYSLGMVLYWLLNNRKLPFEPIDHLASAFEKEDAFKTRISGAEIPEPLHGDPQIRKIIKKAVSFRPEDRYKTADEMLDAVMNAQKNTGSEIDQKPVPDQKDTSMNQQVPVKTEEAAEEPASVLSETVGRNWTEDAKKQAPAKVKKADVPKPVSAEKPKIPDGQDTLPVAHKPSRTAEESSIRQEISHNQVQSAQVKQNNPDFKIDGNILIRYTGCEKNVEIPSEVREIGVSAFKNCISMQKVIIPAGVRTIPASAFEDCINLEKVEFPNGLQAIGANAFRNCRNIKHAALPASTDRIVGGAFPVMNHLNYKEMFLKPASGNKSIVIDDLWLSEYYRKLKKEVSYGLQQSEADQPSPVTGIYSTFGISPVIIKRLILVAIYLFYYSFLVWWFYIWDDKSMFKSGISHILAMIVPLLGLICLIPRLKKSVKDIFRNIVSFWFLLAGIVLLFATVKDVLSNGIWDYNLPFGMFSVFLLLSAYEVSQGLSSLYESETDKDHELSHGKQKVDISKAGISIPFLTNPVIIKRFYLIAIYVSYYAFTIWVLYFWWPHSSDIFNYDIYKQQSFLLKVFTLLPALGFICLIPRLHKYVKMIFKIIVSFWFLLAGIAVLCITVKFAVSNYRYYYDELYIIYVMFSIFLMFGTYGVYQGLSTFHEPATVKSLWISLKQWFSGFFEE